MNLIFQKEKYQQSNSEHMKVSNMKLNALAICEKFLDENA